MAWSSPLALLLLWSLMPCLSSGQRTWKHVKTYHALSPEDETFSEAEIGLEIDPFLFTDSPSMVPSQTPSLSLVPSASPSKEPSSEPSTEPSSIPSSVPSSSPSGQPSSAPTSSPSDQPTSAPSASPTVSPPSASPSDSPPSASPSDSPPSASPSDSPAPTIDSFPNNPEPTTPLQGYFNYNPSSAYGPNNWPSIPVPDDFYWNEFGCDGFGAYDGVLCNHDPDQNRCDLNEVQSPIDVFRTFGASCRDFGHQIRTFPGDFRLEESGIDKRIESNKLRLVYGRRPCIDSPTNTPGCDEPDPAKGDFPNNWGGFTDAMHIDFKAPGEHWVNGESFDGEMQIFHLHPGRRLAPAVAVVIRATEGANNSEFQRALDEFQIVFDQHQADCDAQIRRQKRRIAEAHGLFVGDHQVDEKSHSDVDYTVWGDYSLIQDEPKVSVPQNTTNAERELQRRRWDPYHPELVPSVWFYAYNGTLTEPPCGEWVAWRIIRKAMAISFEQLNQLKNLIFNHVSPTCERTGVQFDESVARPLQPLGDRVVIRCNEGNYLPDDPSLYPEPGPLI